MPDAFADSYALMAQYTGSKPYKRIFETRTLATTSVNLLEFAFSMLRSGKVRESELPTLIGPLRTMIVEPGFEVIGQAATFKNSMLSAGRNCSYADAWGYCTARSMQLPFLTGDEAFKGVPHVEFVKE